jgi:hypothetical protein
MLNLDVSLADLSWPLFIGGQVSRFQSGPIQIHHIMVVYILFPYSNTTNVSSYLRPIFIWALTQIYPRVPTRWALAGVPLSVAPKILSES